MPSTPTPSPEQAAGELWRVQDATGRGPYVPSFSHRWSDRHGDPVPLPWWSELGISVCEAVNMFPVDMHIGCAFRSVELMRRWFSRRELAKLGKLGFFAVKFQPDQIVAETPTQVVFANRRPHHELPPAFRFAA